MRTLLLASAVVPAVLLSAAITPQATAQSRGDLKARCNQLISYFERYGAGRSENSDGARNHTDWGARIDCDNGREAQGVVAMEDLLRRKRFDLPAAPSGVAQSPAATPAARR